MAKPSDPRRPLGRELYKKVQDALQAVQAGRRVLGVTKHLIGDLEALEISSEAELWRLLPVLLQEIITANPEKCYCHAGGHPPRRSYDEEMKDMELWPYHWDSLSQGKRMILKFAIKQDKQGNWVYYHVDVHEDHPRKENDL